MNDKISVLIAARKNSKYLGKFLTGLFVRTDDPRRLDIHIMLNAGDTWNDELVAMAAAGQFPANVNFYREDYQLGRAGLHYYFNDLAEKAIGDWIVYFCEDHFIVMPGWDTYLRKVIAGTWRTNTLAGDLKHDHGALDPNEIWVLVPKFDNCGAMNHVVSRGFYKAMGGVLGRHGWIDSYLNDLITRAWGKYPKRAIRLDDDMFHDFTHDHPNPMDDAHLQSVITPEADKLPKYDSEEYRAMVQEQAEKLKAITGGN